MDEKPEKKIIRETVRDRLTARAFLKKLCLTAGFALVFGIVASLTFVISKPWWEHKENAEASSEAITIFNDQTTEASTEPSTEATTEPDDGADDDELWNSIRPSVQSVANDILTQVTEKDAYYNSRRKTVQQVASSIVTITVRNEEQSWLNQPVSTSGEYFGVVIAVTDSSVLLLTPVEVTGESGSIYASFGSAQLPAEIRGTDTEFGIAVISVNRADIPEAFGDIVPAEMGISSYIQQGSPVTAMGAPTGRTGSAVYGLVTFVDVNVPATDLNIRIIQTDMSAPEGCRGFLINSAGELVGWITSGFSSNTVRGCIAAVSLTDLKTPIETLSNGGAQARLGITGQTITQAVADAEGVPVGVYVTGRASGSGADTAGLLSGDVITAVDGEDIVTYAALGKLITEHVPGDEIALTIMRNNRGQWQEITLKAVLGSR